MTLSQLTSLDATPQALELLNPHTEEKTGVTLTIYPVKSRIGSKVQHEFNMAKIELMKDESNIEVRDGITYLKNELITEIATEMYAKLIIGWDGITDEEGKEESFDYSKILQVIKDDLSIATQIFNFVNNLGNVLKKLEKDL
jgi:hypothetical protein